MRLRSHDGSDTPVIGGDGETMTRQQRWRTQATKLVRLVATQRRKRKRSEEDRGEVEEDPEI